MDNLLLSLDKMSAPGNISYGEEHTFGGSNIDYNAPATPPRLPLSRLNQRARGHTYSSSLSSEPTTNGVDGTPTHYSPYSSSRGRRSNSSSNFQTATAGNSSRRGAPRLLRRTSSETQHTTRLMHSRGTAGKGSKSSAGSSFDYGYGSVISSNKMPLPRSASMDHTLNTISATIPTEDMGGSILDRGRPIPSVHSTYEPPSPVPTVPTGPRRATDPLSSSGQLQSAQSTNSLVFKSSNLRNGTNVGGGNINRTNTPEIPQEIRDQASDFVRASSMRTLPSVQQLGNSSAVSSNLHQKHLPSQAETPSERPGFFRRMFGSSGRGPSPQSSRYVDLDYAKPRQNSQPNHAHITSQIRPDMKSAKSEPLQSPTAAPVVTKKASSFFRRRKKSFSEGGKAPPVPPQITHVIADVEPPTSPSASSLRAMMAPYLSGEAEPTVHELSAGDYPVTPPVEDEDELDIFHSGYTPPLDASLHRSNPLNPRQPGAADPRSGHKTENDAPRMKVKLRKPQHPTLLNNSFLADNSETDNKSIVSAISSTFGLPDEPSFDDGRISPVSPLSETTPKGIENQMSYFGLDDAVAQSQASFHTRDAPAATTALSSNVSSDAEENGFVVVPRDTEGAGSKRADRVWLEPTLSEEKLDSDLSLPLEGAKVSETPGQIKPVSREGNGSQLQSTSSLPIVQVEGDEVAANSSAPSTARQEDPTAEDTDRAHKIFDGDEEFVGKAQAAAWLGENSATSTRTLKAYMQLFDWSGQNIVSAMRGLCEKLTLKAETQQVDRILDAFSRRWCECNPLHGFKATDVVHTICYSLLLLNTDLHLADIEQKMTKVQFVKNTLPTIKRVVDDAAPHAFDDTVRLPAPGARPSLPWGDSTGSVPTSPTYTPEAEDRPSIDFKRNKRLSIRPAANRTNSDGPFLSETFTDGTSNALVHCTWDSHQTQRAWLFDMENVLKSFFNSIKQEALPLHGFESHRATPQHSQTLSLLPSTLRRTGSVLSKAPSETLSYRGRRPSELQSMTMRWHSKNRSKPKLYPASTLASSRTSFDDGPDVWSPAASSTWSKYSMNKTTTTMSVDSLGTYNGGVPESYKQSIGFANALSQAIIREENAETGSLGPDTDSLLHAPSLLEDESLELEGAPWAKEGILKHKHHLESPDKKAKERSWNECFAVIEKGWLRLFSFPSKTTTVGKNTSMRARMLKSNSSPHSVGRSRAPSVTAAVVGGGNWTANASQIAQLLLRQTIASTLPPPGYSKQRPNVWALSLPTGAVHLFQVGTQEIAKEFVGTANYWSARLSKEPLVGGVSNVEYGWSGDVVNPALVALDSGTQGPPGPPGSRGGAMAAGGRGHKGHGSANNSVSMPGRPSMQSSIRGSLDQGFGRARLPGDKVSITEWTPPTQSMMASQLMEVDQLRALRAYVEEVEEELRRHNELRGAVALAVSYRSPKIPGCCFC